ncbi:MAG: hypothetical protein ABEH65_01785 [Halobacteriales archaeon]
MADLWAARGFETHIKDDSVIVVRENEQMRLVCRPHIGRWQGSFIRLFDRDRSISLPEGSTDIVVTTTSPRQARRLNEQLEPQIIGVDTLRNLILYAINPQRGNILCRKYFDHPARSPAETDTNGLVATSGRRIAVLGTIGLIVLHLTGGIIGTPGAEWFFGVGALSTETAPTTITESVRRPSPTPTTTPEPGSATLPPGLSETGLTDTEALIDSEEHRGTFLYLEAHISGFHPRRSIGQPSGSNPRESPVAICHQRQR